MFGCQIWESLGILSWNAPIVSQLHTSGWSWTWFAGAGAQQLHAGWLPPFSPAQDTRGLFHVTIVRLTDPRSRRLENIRPVSLRTFACSTLRRRSYAGRTYDHSERRNRTTNLDVKKAIYHDESECISSINFYFVNIRPIQAKTYVKFYSTDYLMTEKFLIVYSSA